MGIKRYEMTWSGIDIELIYEPLKYGVIAHLEIRSIRPERAPLPITETGYLSHYHPLGTVEASPHSLQEQVRHWLDEKARSKAWKAYVETSRQGELF